MNRVILMGRLTRDPEIRYGQNDPSQVIARYSLAVDRPVRRDSQSQQNTADFIPCVAFGKGAEFVQKFLHKGMKILVVGELRVNSYEKDGVKKTYTEVYVSEHEFCESRSASQGRTNGSYGQPADGYQPQPQWNSAPQRQVSPDFAPASGSGSYYSYSQGAPANSTNVTQPTQPRGGAPMDVSPEGFTPVESITEDQDLPF